MEHTTLTVGGLRFGCFEAGPTSGPLVILCHGFPDTAHTWRDLLPRLADAGYHAVAPFMRGYAPTECPSDGRYGVVELGSDVIGVINAFGAERATLIGHDWGAAAVYSAVAQAPERVSRLVGIAIPPPRALRPSLRTIWGIRHFATFQLKKRSVAKIRKDPMAFLDTIYRRWSPRWDVPREELEATARCFEEPGVIEAALGYYWCFVRDLRRKEVKALNRSRIGVPTLLFGGEADGGLPVSSWKHAPKGFVEGTPFEVEILPGAGHFLHREAPDAFADRLMAWLPKA